MGCQATLDTDIQDHCALQATKFSSLVSERGRDEQMGREAATALESREAMESNGSICGREKVDQQGCGEGDGSCRSSSKPEKLNFSEVMDQMCYSCRRTLAKVKQVDDLPAFILKEAEISDFLL